MVKTSISIAVAVVAILLTIPFLFIDGKIRMYFPRPKFSFDKIPNQQGKVIIITGGTNGVGRASAEQLCAHDAKLIVITGTSQASAEKAANDIKSNSCATSPTKVIGQELKLEDHLSIKKFADWFRSLNEPLHVLMLNAGLASVKLGKTSIGLESTIGINWFGHFYLQQLLQDIVERSAPSRIVILSSGVQGMVPELKGSLESQTMADQMTSTNFDLYGVSKLFNVLHGAELHRRIRAKGINNVHVLSVHPGIVRTEFLSRMVGKVGEKVSSDDFAKTFEKEKYGTDASMLSIINALGDYLSLSPLEGALSQLYAATSPEIVEKGYSGGYIAPTARYVGLEGDLFAIVSPYARNETFATDLWTYGESLIAKINQ